MAYENLMKNKKLSSQTGASSLIKPKSILNDSNANAYQKLQALATMKDRQKITNPEPERTYSTERPTPVTSRQAAINRGAGLTGSEQRDKGIIQPTTRLNINDVFKPKSSTEQRNEAISAYTRLNNSDNTDMEQRAKDRNTVDLYVNKGLTGTERREAAEDAARAAAKTDLQRSKGLTGTERLEPQRELEAKKKSIEAERADMYQNPQNYFDTKRSNYTKEMVAKNFEYDAKVAEVDNQLKSLRTDAYKNLSLEDDFWQKVREGEKMPTADKEQVEGIYSNFDFFSEDERNIYNYLLAKKGEEAAHDYYELNRANAQTRYGEKVARAIDEKKGVGKVAALTANALGTGVAGWMEGVLGSVSREELPQSGLTYASQAIKDDLGVVGAGLYDLGVTVGNMLPSIYISAISAPALASAGVEVSAAKDIAGKIGSGALGLSAGGNAYQQGLREGMTRNQAYWYGTMVGVSEAALQNAMQGVTQLSGGKTGAIADSIKLIENGTLRFVASVGNSALNEGTEEALQAILEPMFKTVVTGKDLNVDWSEVAYNALMGALTGGVFESVGVAQQELDRRNSFTELANKLGGENQAMVSSLVHAMDYAEGTRTRKLGADLSNALQELLDKGASAEVRQFLNNNRKHFSELAYFMKEEADQITPAKADPVRNGTMARVATAQAESAEASGVEAKTKVLNETENKVYAALTAQGIASDKATEILDTVTRIVNGDSTLSNNELIKSGVSKDKRIRAALNELTDSNLDTSKSQQGAGETKTQLREIIERMAARNAEVKAEPLDVAAADAVIATEEMQRAEMAAAELATEAENIEAVPAEQSGAAKFIAYAKPATEAEIQPLSGSVKSEGNVYSQAEVRAIASEEDFTEAETNAILKNFGEMAKAEGIDYEANPDEFIKYAVAQEEQTGIRAGNVSAEQKLATDILRVALADKGVKDVVLVSGSASMAGTDGNYDNGIIYINADRVNNRTYSGIAWTVGHEIVHHAERAGTNLRQNGETVANAPIVNEILDVMTQLAQNGAIRGEYAKMALDPNAMQDYINRKIEAYVAFLTKDREVNGKLIPGMTEEEARRAFNKFDARAEIAADFLGTLMGINSLHAAGGRVGSKYGPVDLFAMMDESKPGLLKQIKDFVAGLRDSVKAIDTHSVAERNAKANTQRMLTKLSRTLGEAMDKVAAASEADAETDTEVEGGAKSESDSGNLARENTETKHSDDDGKVEGYNPDLDYYSWEEQVTPEQRRELERAEALRRVFRSAREMYGEGEEFISRMEADTQTAAGRERLRQVFRPQTEQARAEQRTQDDLRLQRQRDREAQRRLEMRKAFNLEKKAIREDAKIKKREALKVQKATLDELWKKRMENNIERVKAQAAERLNRRIAEERERSKENMREQRVLSRVSAKEAKKVFRNAQETELPDYSNSDVDTLRKLSEKEPKTIKITEIAQKLRHLVKRAYASFANQAQTIDNFSKLQREGVRAGSLVNMVYGDGATIETIYQEALVGRDGRRMGDSMKKTMLVWDKDGNVDNEKQALLQDYMLHVHNIDRMSFTTRALARVEAFEAQYPWLADIKEKDFAYIAGLTEKEAKKEEQTKRRNVILKYIELRQLLENAEDKPIFKDADGKVVSAETSRGIVAKYETEQPWLKEKAEGIYKWWDAFMREWAVGSTLSAEDYAMWKELYPHYVPTYREGDKTNSPVVQIGGANAQLMDIFKSAKGSTRTVRDITESFSMLVGKIVDTSRKNELIRNIVDTALLDETGEFGEFAVFDWEGYYNSDNGLSAAMKEDAWLNGTNVKAVEDAHAEAIEDLGNGIYRITAFGDDGGRYSAWVSPEMYRSLVAVTSPSKLLGEGINKLTKIGGKLTGISKAFITGYNIHFIARNTLRDISTAIVNSAGIGSTTINGVTGIAFFKYYGKAWAQVVTNSEEWQRFKALGGTHMGYYGSSVDWAKRMQREGKLWRRVVDKIGALSEATESITRFGEYLATIDKLGDNYEARVQGIKNAAEITVDFSRKGEYGKFVNAWIPYWNPAVQGIDKLFRQVFDNGDTVKEKFKNAGVTLTRASIVALLPELLQYAWLKMWHRDDEWEEVTDRIRDNYFLIPLRNKKKFLKLPKNREWGTLLGTPLMRILEAVDGRSDPFDNYVEDALLANLSIAGIEDAFGIGTAFDLATNKDFAGRTIVPYAYQEVPKSLQYDSDTFVGSFAIAKAYNETFGALAESLGYDMEISPMQLDYLLGDYFGDIGKMIMRAAPLGLFTGNVTFKEMWRTFWDAANGSWVVDARYSNFYVNEYYDIIDYLEQGVAIEKLLNPDGYKDSYIYSLERAFNTAYKEEMGKLTTEAAGLPDGEKKDEVKEKISVLAIEADEWFRNELADSSEDPFLRVKYVKYSPALQDTLIYLDEYSETYSFKPYDTPSESYVDPRDKNKEYILTEEQKLQFKILYNDTYNEVMTEAVTSAKFGRMDAEEQAEYLESLRDSVREEAKEAFFAWLRREGVKSTKREK